MTIERKNDIMLDGVQNGDMLNFNKILNMTHFDSLPENLKIVVKKMGYKIDKYGHVVDNDGNNISYDRLAAEE